jgi:hypothetical protein
MRFLTFSEPEKERDSSCEVNVIGTHSGHAAVLSRNLHRNRTHHSHRECSDLEFVLVKSAVLLDKRGL